MSVPQGFGVRLRRQGIRHRGMGRVWIWVGSAFVVALFVTFAWMTK